MHTDFHKRYAPLLGYLWGGIAGTAILAYAVSPAAGRRWGSD